ncbi:hypothetical protein [Viridibacillus arvi]|uniref:hypothetical protein n=1 Tax=Viridibacillus arvi TaxID=263475 RepID=UPI0034CF6E30
MFAFFIVICVIVFFGAMASGILGGIGNLLERKGVKGGLQGFLQEQGITNYEYQYTADNQYIVHDKGNKMFWIYGNGFVGRGYETITDVKLSIDDSVAYQSSISSAVGRAVVGGVLLGGVGAVIGGVTGKKNGKKIVHKVDLILSFNTPDTPYKKVSFMQEEKGVDVFSDQYKTAEEDGLYWSNLIASYMPQN